MNNTWDAEVIFINKSPGDGAIGSKPAETDADPILAKRKPVPGVEFYNAGKNDIRPSVILVVHPFEYGGQRELKFNGLRYRVIRDYLVNDDELELTCEVKEGRRNGN